MPAKGQNVDSPLREAYAEPQGHTGRDKLPAGWIRRAREPDYIARLRDLVNRDRFDVVSVDVFDTLLLRSTKPEIFRFWQLAKRHFDVVDARARGNLNREDFFTARVLAAKAAYRNAPVRDGSQEVDFSEILHLMIDLLKLPASCTDAIRSAEMAYEKSELQANDHLIKFLAAAHAGGARLIYMSDMYLSGALIDELLEACGVQLEFHQRFSSADSGLSKRSGELFRHVEQVMSVDGDRCLHLGDHPVSDVIRANEAGWTAVHTPRSRPWHAASAMKRKAFEAYLYARNLWV